MFLGELSRYSLIAVSKSTFSRVTTSSKAWTPYDLKEPAKSSRLGKRSHVLEASKWKSNILWRKKFNFDYSDGWSYYWHDLHKVPQVSAKQQADESSLIARDEYGSGGKVYVEFLSDRINALRNFKITFCVLLRRLVDFKTVFQPRQCIHPHDKKYLEMVPE